MLSAALWSRSKDVPQKLHSKVRITSESFFGDFLPQQEQVCEVFLRVNLMEVETVSFGYVPSPLKELSPRRIGNTLAEVFVLHHVGNAQVFSDKDVIFSDDDKVCRRVCR